MKPRIYIETSVISYLAARPSADIVNAGRQLHSLRLWRLREQCELLISDVVMDEVAVGDPSAAAQRQWWCEQLVRLPTPPDTLTITHALLKSKAVPQKAYTDAVHIAIAALSKVQYIASWNFKHIVGATARKRIEAVLTSLVESAPIIATPEEITEEIK